MRHIFCLATLICGVLSYGAQGLAEDATPHKESPPRAEHVTQPLYSREARNKGQEGWVLLSLSISDRGKITSANVIDSYPKGIFEDSVLKATRKWRYTPRMRDGVAVADDGIGFGVTFHMAPHPENRKVTPANIKLFNDLALALNEGDFRGADQVMKNIRTRYEEGSFVIVESAQYLKLLAIYERGKGRYIASSTAARKALMLSSFFPRTATIQDLRLIELRNYLDLDMNDRVVDQFDSWTEAVRSLIPSEFAERIESLREQGFGTGYKYGIDIISVTGFKN